MQRDGSRTTEKPSQPVADNAGSPQVKLTGDRYGEADACPSCEGFGWQTIGLSEWTETCPVCGGTGVASILGDIPNNPPCASTP